MKKNDHLLENLDNICFLLKPAKTSFENLEIEIGPTEALKGRGVVAVFISEKKGSNMTSLGQRKKNAPHTSRFQPAEAEERVSFTNTRVWLCGLQHSYRGIF